MICGCDEKIKNIKVCYSYITILVYKATGCALLRHTFSTVFLTLIGMVSSKSEMFVFSV